MSSWVKTKTIGEPVCRDTQYAHISKENCWQRSSLFAGDGCAGFGSVELREARNYNGSGASSGAFGGAKSWPHLSLRFAFPEGREDLRTKLGESLRAFVDEFVKENGLEPP